MSRDAVTNSQASDYLVTSAKLAALKGAMVPMFQPLMRVKSYQQAALLRSGPISALQAYREIAASGGAIKGLYQGAVSAILKEVLRNGVYKAPLVKGAPDLVKRLHAGAESKAVPLVQHVSIAAQASGVAAVADTVLGGPLDRYATYRTTSLDSSGRSAFAAELKSRGSLFKQVNFIYQGSSANTMKSALSFFALFSLSGPVRQLIYRQYGLEPGDKVTASAAATSALATGAMVAVAGAPFDVVKSGQQQPGTVIQKGAARQLQANLRVYGFRAAFVGMPIKLALACMGWAAVSLCTQKDDTVPDLERAWHSYSG